MISHILPTSMLATLCAAISCVSSSCEHSSPKPAPFADLAFVDSNLKNAENQFLVSIRDKNGTVNILLAIDKVLADYIVESSEYAREDYPWKFPISTSISICQFYIDGHIYRWRGFAQLLQSDGHSFELYPLFSLDNPKANKSFPHICKYMAPMPSTWYPNEEPKARRLQREQADVSLLIEEYRKLILYWTQELKGKLKSP